MSLLLIFWLACSSWAQEKPPKAAPSGPIVVSEFQRLMNEKDYLSARVFLKSNWQVRLNRGQWRTIRKRLHAEPKVGWDILRWWDSKSVAGLNAPGAALDKEIQAADRLFAQKKYLEAYALYKNVTTLIRKRQFSENRFLYYDLVTSMARALYANGDFLQSYRLYMWIPPIYPRYKQVLFERMWAAFRAGEIEHALGDLVAQYSPFFGGVINPEAFLVQIYAYKKLCQDQDLDRVLLLVQKFRKRLEENGFSVQDWALSDWETMPLARLSVQTEVASSDWVEAGAREQEKQLVLKILNRKYAEDRKEYLSNLTKVMAYAKMAFDLSTKELARIRELPAPDALIKQRLEMWPIDGPEDWLDEIGNKFFLGKSKCGPESKKADLKLPPAPSAFAASASEAILSPQPSSFASF